MHEMAYAEGILAVALDVAEGQHVRRVQVHVGDLHRIVSDSLQFCFELASEDTPAAGARLDVEVVAGDGMQVDAVELDDGWRYRPDRVEPSASGTRREA
jgi:Zn finger protein HypA/HybF involved in hydrogenase expression